MSALPEDFYSTSWSTCMHTINQGDSGSILNHSETVVSGVF